MIIDIDVMAQPTTAVRLQPCRDDRGQEIGIERTLGAACCKAVINRGSFLGSYPRPRGRRVPVLGRFSAPQAAPPQVPRGPVLTRDATWAS